MDNNGLKLDNPGRRFRPPYPAGSCRKGAEKSPYPAGKHRKWKQYSGGNFFPMNSCEFPVLSGGKRSEIIGKNPRKFRLEYCFHLPVCFQCVPVECIGNAPDPVGSCRTSFSWEQVIIDRNQLRYDNRLKSGTRQQWIKID